MANNIYYFNAKSYKQQKRSSYKVKAFFLILLLVLLLILSYLVFKNAQLNLVMAQYKELVDGFTSKGLVIREEQVYFAPTSGYAYLKYKEGERVSYGQIVMEMKKQQDSFNLYNNQAGLISYATDGLEGVLTPSSIVGWKDQPLDSLKRQYKQVVSGDYLEKGEAAFRIIDNNYLYLVIETSLEEIKRYRVNELVFIKPLNLDKGLIDGYVWQKILGEKKGLLVVKLNLFLQEWLNLRWVEVLFIKNIYRGIVVPRQAIFTQPQGEGVLVKSSKGSFIFKEVKVLAGNQDEVVVEGLEFGDNVVLNPAAVNYGRGD